MKEMGTLDVCDHTSPNKAVLTKGIKNVLYLIAVKLSRKWDNGNKDSPDKLSSLVIYVPGTTFKNLQIVNCDYI